VTRVLVAPAAPADLERLIVTHSLPANTLARVAKSIEPLEQFPLLGASLEGRWDSYRFVLGPWRWMLIVYAYDRDSDIVAIVTIQDARSSTAVTTT
jgi:ParE toxin of type II toxin-antitoxin system, parDE